MKNKLRPFVLLTLLSAARHGDLGWRGNWLSGALTGIRTGLTHCHALMLALIMIALTLSGWWAWATLLA